MGSERERMDADPCDTQEEEDDCQANQDQCPVLPGGALKVLLFITPIIVLVNIHFAFVLYTHYKNSGLPESQGGCNDRKVEEDNFDDDY